MPEYENETTAPTLLEVTRRKIYWCDPNDLEYYSPLARTHSEQQLQEIALAIHQHGFELPVITGAPGVIFAGQGQVEMASRMGFSRIPAITLSDLTEKERKLYIKTMLRYAAYVGWCKEILQIDLRDIKKVRLNTMAKINGRFFHANGEEEKFVSRSN